MNYVRLAFIYLVHKPLFTILTVAFLIIPVTIITSVLIFNHEVKIFFLNNISGADLILSAKGSYPEAVGKCLFYTGPDLPEVNLSDVRQILRNPDIEYAVPLLMSGNYKDFKIVGTNDNIKRMFDLRIRNGNWSQSEFGSIIGSDVAAKTGLKTGDKFYFAENTGNFTDSITSHAFRISGILGKMNSSIDNIILTSVENLWLLNDRIQGRTLNNDTMINKQPGDYFPFDFPDKNNEMLTAALIKLRAPLPVTGFIKQESLQKEFQVVNPLAEIDGQYQSLRFTLSALVWSGISVFVIGLLALFVRLFYFVKERSGDLLLLRTMGAPGNKIMLIIVLQGILITDVAAFSGILLAHGVLGIMSTFPSMGNFYGVSGTTFIWDEVIIYFAVITVGCVVSLFPAVQARRSDALLIDRNIF